MSSAYVKCNAIQIVRSVCMAFVLISTGDAFAAGLEKLLMPGRVIEGHAEFESECIACHDASSEKAVAALCMSCHEDVGVDRRAKTGFHGRFPAAQSNECVTCHTDHEGRDADIVAIHAGLFDHRWTDFALTGSHLSAGCADCHADGDAYRDAPTSCHGCHAEDDTHQGGLGQQCDSSHTAANWDRTTFDHALTGYSLTGRHAGVECSDCHRDNQFSSTPKRCASCHAIDDVHAGGKGNACQDCHSTSSWSGIRFDHATTGFQLADSHAGLQCNDCHQREDFKDSFVDGCIECHRVEDDHQGRNGEQCDTCHRPTEWSDTSFDHAETGFSLVEAHSGLNCSSCHKAAAMDVVPSSCGECHAVDDSHAGQLGEQCSACHSQTSWTASVYFDHDLSSFPLTGLHATIACGACHASNRFHDAATECIDCHREADPHAGSLGENCGSCHNSNDWMLTTFDHNLHTDFSIDGAHLGLQCNDCHRDPGGSSADVPASCGGCHLSDDVHDGQFGSQCDQCHSTSAWSDVDSLSGRRR